MKLLELAVELVRLAWPRSEHYRLAVRDNQNFSVALIIGLRLLNGEASSGPLKFHAPLATAPCQRGFFV